VHDERLVTPGYYYSSPAAADNRIYIDSTKGVVTVIDTGPKLNVLTTNKPDAGILAPSVLASGYVYVRTESHLYVFGK